MVDADIGSSESNKIAQNDQKQGGCASLKQDQSIPKKENVPQKEKPTKRQAAVNWHDIVGQLRLGGRAAELIKHCLLESHINDSISLNIEASSAGLLSDAVKSEIQLALSEYYGKTIRLKLSVLPSSLSKENASQHESETPAQRSARMVAEAQQQAERNIATDPFVIELQNRFGAQLVPGSVSPK